MPGGQGCVYIRRKITNLSATLAHDPQRELNSRPFDLNSIAMFIYSATCFLLDIFCSQQIDQLPCRIAAFFKFTHTTLQLKYSIIIHYQAA